ncbi:MAG: hypothetical protein IK097_02905 [Clostridia bacterium]|nr:hypothetical protein [Clostridia bacterium]
MKRIVSAISFILIFVMIITASAIPAGAEGVGQTLYKPAGIRIDGKNDDNAWQGYEAYQPFGETSSNNDGKINTGNDVSALTVQTARVDKNTAKFKITAMLVPGKDVNSIGVRIAVEGSQEATITIANMAEATGSNIVIADDDNIKMIGAISYSKPSSEMICEIEAVNKAGEFGDRIDFSFSVVDGNGSVSSVANMSPPSITTTTKKSTTTKPPKSTTTKPAKTTTEKSTTTKPEKTTTTKATTTATTEISHRTRRATTAKSTTEKKTEKASKGKTTKVKTTKAKTTKAKKTATKAERSLAEKYSAEAAVATTVITSAEITAEQASVQTVTETDKSLFGGEKLSKSSLYKLITGAVALVLFAIIGVSAVRTKSAADKADEKPFSEKQKEEEKEDKEE